jgi:hypothetical protein
MTFDDETVRRVIARAEQAIAQEAVEAMPAWVLDWIERTERRLSPGRDNADSIMYQAGRDAHRDGAPAPGEYCVEGDAYRAGWYDADEDAQP